MGQPIDTSASTQASGYAAKGSSPPPTLYSNRTIDVTQEKRKCSLCVQLGAGGDNHSREWCYIDPKLKVYKPEVRQRRVAQARARGLKIPPELEVEDKPSGHNLIASLEAIVGLVGDAGGSKDVLVD